MSLARVLCSVALVLAQAGAGLASFSTPAAPASECGAAWRIVSSPDPATGYNELYGVDVISSDNIWAVGRSFGATGGYRTLAMHWNGTAWDVVPTPNVGSNYNALFRVAAISANDVWAVGSYSNDNVVHLPLIEHWNGSEWTVVPGAVPPGNGAFLYGVAAVSVDDVWAVGYYNVGTDFQKSLIEHWDGTQWTIVPSPVSVDDHVLWDVAVVSANSVWAVGNVHSEVTNNYTTLTEHWDGNEWSIVPSPNPPPPNINFLWGVDVLSGNNIWAVGRSYTGSRYPALIERWNGSAWTIVPDASPALYNELYDAEAISADNVWVVGRYTNDPGFAVIPALIEHWNGSAWNVVPTPLPANSGSSYLYAIKAVSENDIWAVGAYFSETDMRYHTLVLRYSNIPCVTPTGAVSRKTHGAAGIFDVNLPLTGNPGIECRTGGASGNYRVIVTFAVPVTVTSANVSSGTGSVSSVSASGKKVTVNLTGVANAQTIAITLVDVNDGANSSNVVIPMSVLLGDTTANGSVNSSDIGQTKSRSGQTAAASNFRSDVTVNGSINTSDIALTKSKSGTALP